MKPNIIASDPGIDDLVGLLLLNKLGANLEHCLVSSFGNGPIQYTGRNAREFISFVTPHWKYLEGASLPQNGKLEHPWPDYFHGPDAVWGIHPDTNTKHIKVLYKHPNYPSLISLCPLTVANQILKNGKLKAAVVMGGAFGIPGNETLFAETNIAFDVDAAVDFFTNCHDIAVKLVPLDVTRKVFWTKQVVMAIPENSDQNLWIKKLLLTWFDKYNHDKEKDFNLHDPLAIYLASFPQKAKWHSSGVKVIGSGVKRGQTILTKVNPVCQIAMDLDDPDAISRDIYSILFNKI